MLQEVALASARACPCADGALHGRHQQGFPELPGTALCWHAHWKVHRAANALPVRRCGHGCSNRGHHAQRPQARSRSSARHHWLCTPRVPDLLWELRRHPGGRAHLLCGDEGPGAAGVRRGQGPHLRPRRAADAWHRRLPLGWPDGYGACALRLHGGLRAVAAQASLGGGCLLTRPQTCAHSLGVGGAPPRPTRVCQRLAQHRAHPSAALAAGIVRCELRARVGPVLLPGHLSHRAGP
mmetsp:Transcript_35052/g.111346  ORF Transcript_35052/g.111346 Transcript_35052/m.111346 type:complete len:238 (-) Transcript_35052:418-1131(-)